MVSANSKVNRMLGKLMFACFALLTFVCSVNTQASDLTIDYSDIETVEVVGQAVVRADSGTGTVASINLIRNVLTPAFVIPDAIALTPSTNIRTNSRGETLVSVRGSGDRQLAVFFDGASVNVPWDNRIDLNILPLSGVSQVNVSSGPSAIRYGGGTAGGVVEILPTTDHMPSINVEAGSGQQRRIDGKFGFGTQEYSLVLAGGHWQRDGLVAERSSRSLFSANNDELITNSDRKQTNFLGRFSHKNSNGDRLAVSVLYNSADYGVAPEQGANFSNNDARFWRYPKSIYLLTTVNGRFGIADNTTTEITAWKQTFDQDIQSFTDTTYSVIEDTQQDRNDTYGARTIITHETEHQSLSVNASVLWSRHDQDEFDLFSGTVSEDRFTQQTFGFGLDYTRVITDALSTTFGVGYDVFDPKLTAGRESTGHFSGINAVAEMNYQVDSAWALRATAGRRVRLPTMRELFGDAIGRFALNSSLKPEETWQFEIAASHRAEAFSFQLVPFFSITENTLDQRRVLVSGDLLRQRFNRNGSYNYGLETVGAFQLSDKLSIDGHATWNNHHVQWETVDNSTRRLYLSDRPNWLARVSALYQLGAQTTFGLNVVYRGEARSQDGDGNFQQVDAATQLGVAFRHQISGASDSFGVALYLRADNLTDTFVEPQLGLPDQGRTFRFGLTASL